MKFAPGQDRGKTSKTSMHTQPKIEAGTEILHLGWKGVAISLGGRIAHLEVP